MSEIETNFRANFTQKEKPAEAGFLEIFRKIQDGIFYLPQCFSW